MKEDSYIGSGPSILAMASLDTDQIVVLSAWVIVLQQSHLPLIVQHKTLWCKNMNVLAGTAVFGHWTEYEEFSFQTKHPPFKKRTLCRTLMA